MDPDNQLFEKTRTLVMEEYVKANGGVAAVGFDPSFIIEIIMDLLSGCFNKDAKSLKESCASCGWKDMIVLKSSVRRMMREEYGGMAYSRFNGEAVVKAVIESGKRADVADIRAMMSMSGVRGTTEEGRKEMRGFDSDVPNDEQGEQARAVMRAMASVGDELPKEAQQAFLDGISFGIPFKELLKKLLLLALPEFVRWVQEQLTTPKTTDGQIAQPTPTK